MSPGKRRWAAGALLLFAALALFAVGAVAQELADSFPEELAGMRLMKLQRGQEALDEIDALHGKPIVASEAVIGTYHAGSGPPAMVWVSRPGSEGQASDQVTLMVERMLAADNSPFHSHSQEQIQGVTVHSFQGMGQMHCIWNRGDTAWWISAPMNRWEPMLEHFLAK